MESPVTTESYAPLRGRRAQIANYTRHERPELLPADTPDDVIRERAKELFNLGFNLLAVARRIGIQPKRLRAIMTGEAHSPAIERRLKVAAMVVDGHDLEYIANRLGVQASTVREDLKVLRVSASAVSTKGRRMEKRRDDLRKLHQQGRTANEMADELGLTLGQVRYALDVMGLEWRGRVSAGS